MAINLIPRTILESNQKRAELPPSPRLVTQFFSNFIIDNTTGILSIRSLGVFSFVSVPVDHKEKIEVEWYNSEIDGLAIQSVGIFNGRISNSITNLYIESTGRFIEPVIFSNAISNLGIKSISRFDNDVSRKNWIKWANIGSLDFTIGKDNVAGERPLDWKGYTYAIKKLLGKVVVFGENGVSILNPSGIYFGLETIYRVGLKSKNAVAGNDTFQFFIDKKGQMWKLSEGLELLDYSEYFSEMTNSLVMSFDNANMLLYICDGNIGYIYDIRSKSLGRGQINITGISYQDGFLYVVAPEDILDVPFEICTDIYDFGTRNIKTIKSLEFGINLTLPFYAAIDYRRNKSLDFTRTPWVQVPQRGIVNLIAFGREFRIRVKTKEYEQFSFDSITINGIIHNN